VSTGRKRIAQLADNAKFFRQAMKRMGFIIFGLCVIHDMCNIPDSLWKFAHSPGNDSSPIVPMLIYYPGKNAFVSSHHVHIS
jgi:hypothetical protein